MITTITFNTILLFLVLVVQGITLYRQKAVKDLKNSLEAYKSMVELFDPQKLKTMGEVNEQFYAKKLKLEVSKQVEKLKLLAEKKFDAVIQSLIDESIQFAVIALSQGTKEEQRFVVNTYFPENKELIFDVLEKYRKKKESENKNPKSQPR